MGCELEFYRWIEQVPVTGVIHMPQLRVAKEMAQAALQYKVPHGRITLWLWTARGKKMAFAMARKGGEGGDKPVNTVLAAPPYNDADKAEFTYLGERA